MDNNQLSKFFPISPSVSDETEKAILSLYKSSRDLAQTLNTLLPESNSKMELIMRVFHVMRDAEMSLRLDGPSRMTPMIVSGREQ